MFWITLVTWLACSVAAWALTKSFSPIIGVTTGAGLLEFIRLKYKPKVTPSQHYISIVVISTVMVAVWYVFRITR
jgi:hypothetical protein